MTAGGFFFMIMLYPILFIFGKIPIYIRTGAFIGMLFISLFSFFTFELDIALSIFLIPALICMFFLLSTGIKDGGESIYYSTLSYVVYLLFFIFYYYFRFLENNIENLELLDVLPSEHKFLIIEIIFLTIFLYVLTKYPSTVLSLPSKKLIIYTPSYRRSDRLLYYLILFSVVIYVSLFIFYYFELIDTDIDSARYMISALIQSEAAIAAIVITFTLVSVQHAASSYSTRVIDVFKLRNQDFWIVLITYIVSMIYGLGVLKLLRNSNYDQLNSESFYTLHQLNLDAHVSLVYSIGIFAFISLIPFMSKTLSLLKPSDMIKILSEEITQQNLISFVRKKQKEEYYKDPILPIIDILRISLLKYDYETVRIGLQEFKTKILSFLLDENIMDDDINDILVIIFDHFRDIELISIDKINKETTRELTELIGNIGLTVSSIEKPKATTQVVLFLEEMGKMGKKQKMDFDLSDILCFMYKIKSNSQNLGKIVIDDISHSIEKVKNT